MARLAGIAFKTEKYGPMLTLSQVRVSTETGITGDYRGLPGKRQVTILAKEAFEAACAELDQTIPWTSRRANILIEGLKLEQTTGKKLQIGGLILEITGETEPCHRMDEQCSGLRNALTPHWRGGVTSRVMQSGDIRIGDEVILL